MEYWRKSIRLDGWDYRFPSFYFVTICPKDRKHYFGEIKDEIMGLSVQGCSAWYFWKQIPSHFPNVRLDEFVVMPNHVCGIIQIIPNKNGLSFVKPNSVGMLHATSQQNGGGGNRMSEISPKSGSLTTIIRSYKSAHTRWCNQKGYESGWQARFYDHIIRNQESLNRIREYIHYNPLNWEYDMDNAF